MNKNELQKDTISQLASGTVYTSEAGMRVIIGETDVVAFEDAHGWQVAEDVLWNNVEDFEVEDVLGHLLTSADFGTGVNGDLLYIGPYNVAKDFIKAHDNTAGTNFNHNTRLWRVELADGNSFGVADTLEMAWRYAMGAEFGPIDDGFVPFRLK